MIQTIKRFFKKDSKVFNIHHPLIKDKAEYKFSCNGVKYYSFIDDYKMLQGRYTVASRFFRELNLCITQDLLREYLSIIQQHQNKGELAKAIIKTNELITRSEMMVEEETLYRLASVVYFDENESLDGYDKVYNDKKIAAWKEEGQLDFFYITPMSDYINLQTLSKNDLAEYLNQDRAYNQKLRQLMYEL